MRVLQAVELFQILCCFVIVTTTMLSRLLPRPSHFRALTLISSKFQPQPRPQPQPQLQLQLRAFLIPGRFFSSNGGGDDKDDNWNLSPDAGDEHAWEDGDDVHRPWTLSSEEDEDVLKDFDVGDDSLASTAEAQDTEADVAEQTMRLEREERALTAILQGSRQSVNDIITASGITSEMIDSLIALKDFEGIEGLPPLEELRKEKGKRNSSEAETERLKQEEAANARTRQVDSKGRAYGTGRRKCSVARVWIQPGDGKFVINEKDFDVYFPILDYRAALLRPFSESKTLGMWDVTCNVKGGGVTGQVGAILLGISRALQNWEPDLRPPLKAVGFLTRDPRMVERKKPGKAKARKSFQWVKR